MVCGAEKTTKRLVDILESTQTEKKVFGREIDVGRPAVFSDCRLPSADQSSEQLVCFDGYSHHQIKLFAWEVQKSLSAA